MAKIIRKIDFLYNSFPKKAISLRKCTQKKIAFGEKKSPNFFSRLRRDTVAPPGGGGGCYCPFRLLCYCATALIPKPAIPPLWCALDTPSLWSALDAHRSLA